MLGPVEPSILALSGVSKQYGKVRALAGLDLNVHRGEIYGLLGRNGAGKSTSLRIVMGVTQPDTGVVALFGEAVKPSDVRVRQRLGYVAQEQHFYEWMLPERLGRFVAAFYPTWDALRFRELLKRFDVPARKVRGLSGGTKVKLGLALALAHRPWLLVLDEPTAGLDAVSRREFLDIVRAEAKSGEQTTIFSSHLIDDVESVSNRVGIIEGGRMLYDGSLPELSSHVRRAVLPASSAADGGSTPFPAALSGLPVRILEDRVVREQRLVTLWLDDPRALSELEQRSSELELVPVPLEETFIALVRGTGARAAGTSE